MKKAKSRTELPEKPKWKKNQLEHCKKCKHDHVAKAGPCTEWGCGCHATHDAAQPEHDRKVREFIKKKYSKKHKGEK